MTIGDGVPLKNAMVGLMTPTVLADAAVGLTWRIR